MTTRTLLILTTLCAMMVVGCSKPKCTETQYLYIEYAEPDPDPLGIILFGDTHTDKNGCILMEVIPFNPIINHSEIK